MPRLPTPGGDNGNWGDILNEYLSVSLSGDGKLKPDIVGNAHIKNNSIGTTQLQDGAITRSKLSSAIQDELDSKLENVTGHVTAGSNITLTGLGTSASPYEISASNSGGDVTGPGSSTINAVARFNGASGKVIKGSGLYVDDSGRIGNTAAPYAQLDIGGLINADNPSPIIAQSDLVAALSANVDGVAGVAMTNTHAGGDFRFTIQDTTGHYLAFAQPGVSSSFTPLFGLNRNTTDFIFSSGGTSRDLAIGPTSTNNIHFGTSSTVKMTISGSGNVGIGTTAPTHSLTMPSAASGIVLYNTTDQTTNYERLRMRWASNAFTIGTETAGTATSSRSLVLVSSSTANSASLTVGRVAMPFLDFVSNGTALAGSAVRMNSIFSGTAVAQTGLQINPTISQSGTASYTALLVNPDETSTGSGAKTLADFQVGGVSKARIDNTGTLIASNTANYINYNTADQTTNWERIRYFWSTNTFNMTTEAGGSGVMRGITMNGASTVFTMSAGGATLFRNNTAITSILMVTSNSMQAASGNQAGILVSPTINQSGTASYTALLVNPSESATGSGPKLLADMQLAGVSRFKVANDGLITASNRITNVTNPTGAQDAATKSYVDTQVTNAADAAPYSSVTWTGAVALTPASANTYNVSITGNTTLTLNTPSVTKSFMITCVITQDGTGSRTLTTSGVKWSYAMPPALSTAANATDVVHFFWTGTQWLGMLGGMAYA